MQTYNTSPIVMDPTTLINNERRFDVITTSLDQSDDIINLLDQVASVNSVLDETHWHSVIESFSDVDTLLNERIDDSTYNRLLANAGPLENILSLLTNLEDSIDSPAGFNSAIDALRCIENLNRDYGHHCNLNELIYRRAQVLKEFLIANLCDRLETSKTINEHEVKHAINNLIKCGNFSDRDLRLKYLQARDNWFINACQEDSATFDNVVTVYSKGLPMIFNEYKSIFSDECGQSDLGLIMSSSNSPSRESGAIINSWLLLKASVFVASLEVYLRDINQSASLTPTMIGDTIEKCFKLTSWLSTIGFDFSPQLNPLFAKAILDELKRKVESSTAKFESSFASIVSKSIESLLLPVDDEVLRISDKNPADKALPKSIEHYPIFKIYCLHLIDSLRWIVSTKHLIMPICLSCETYSILSASLTHVTKALSIAMNMDNNSHHPILTKIAVSFITDVLPWISDHCEVLFPERLMLSAIGLSRSEFKIIASKDPEKLKNFRLNFKYIALPLRASMSALVDTLED